MFFLLIVVVAIMFGFVRFNQFPRSAEMATVSFGLVAVILLLYLHPASRPDWHFWGKAFLWVVVLAVPILWYSKWVKSLHRQADTGVEKKAEYVLTKGREGLSEDFKGEIANLAVENEVTWAPESFCVICWKDHRYVIGEGQVNLILQRAEILSLWVEDTERHKGYGSGLVTKLEKEARIRGAKVMAVSLFDWQGQEFFGKLGYKPASETVFPGGERRIDLTKELE